MGYPTSNGSTEVGEQVSQNATATAIDPTFGNASLSVYKFSSKIFAVPWELLQDAQADVLAFVGQRAMDRIGRIQNQKFTTGSGTGEPTGFVTAATVGKIGTTGQTLTIIYDDLVDMIESVDAGHTSLTWMMSQQMRSIVRRIKDATTSRPVWIPEFEDTGASLGGSLLGYPVWINNDMATPAANAKTVAFGNFEKYMIRDAMEFTLFRFDDSPYTKLGQVGFLAWMRSGGNLIDTAAVKTYQHSAT
jgi:HK97 family phage major capsid protein